MDDDLQVMARIMRLVFQCPKCGVVGIYNFEALKCWYLRCTSCDKYWVVGVIVRPGAKHRRRIMPPDVFMPVILEEPVEWGGKVNRLDMKGDDDE